MCQTEQQVLFQKLNPDAIAPTRATEGSAGYDISCLLPQPLTLEPGQRALLPTGLAIALPDPSVAAFLFARSGLAIKHGITLANCVGVIDSDYRGEVKVGVVNLSQTAYTFHSGDRIAQLCIMPVCSVQFIEGDLSETRRGAGGFGSSGR